MKTAPAAYSSLQKALHWGTALLVIPMIPLGVYMVNRGAATNFDALTNTLYTGHKSIGFLVLWLVILRIVIRIRRGAPAPVSTLTPIERFMSNAVHLALYAGLIAVPVLGWAGASAYPALGVFFGLSLPPILPVNSDLAGKIFGLHKFVAILMGLAIMAHFGAAMMHWLIKKDGVMKRMLG